MSKKDYKKELIDKLLKKYNTRMANNVLTNRRIIVKPTELYRKYHDNNADIAEKQKVNETVETLLKKAAVTVDYLKFSTDIEKIYLCEERLEILYEILKNEYGITPQNVVLKQAVELVEQYNSGVNAVSEYSDAGSHVLNEYCKMLRSQMEDPRYPIDLERIDANLKMLRFLEQNEEDLYVREVSMLVYGDSKWFEKNNYDEICNIIRNMLGMLKEESERNDAVLARYHINPAEQDIFLKGDWKIDWENQTLETAHFKGGIAITSNDIPRIRKITINASAMMTIENKTSYQRMDESDMAMMYLGGFANRYQIAFLKKVIQDNPDIVYYHFGDIDVGGFWIHRHLCSAVSAHFLLYAMGIEQLADKRFEHCLKELTEKDISRMESLMQEEEYKEVLEYMKAHNVKLEQEIVSYYLQHNG